MFVVIFWVKTLQTSAKPCCAVWEIFKAKNGEVEVLRREVPKPVISGVWCKRVNTQGFTRDTFYISNFYSYWNCAKLVLWFDEGPFCLFSTTFVFQEILIAYIVILSKPQRWTGLLSSFLINWALHVVRKDQQNLTESVYFLVLQACILLKKAQKQSTFRDCCLVVFASLYLLHAFC